MATRKKYIYRIFLRDYDGKWFNAYFAMSVVDVVAFFVRNKRSSDYGNMRVMRHLLNNLGISNVVSCTDITDIVYRAAAKIHV